MSPHDDRSEPVSGSPATLPPPAISTRPNPGDVRPGHDAPPAGAGVRDGEQRPSRRLWSARRIPAALTALVVLFCAGMLLFDVARVRAGREAAAWRRGLVDELARRPLDDVWMLTGAAVAAALGLILIVLALSPGMRRRLPLRIPVGRGPVRATLDHVGAAHLLRDAAMRVPGVSRAKVRVRRRRVTVRADVRFRDPRQVRDDLVTVIRYELRDRLALAHTPRLTVRARRTP